MKHYLPVVLTIFFAQYSANALTCKELLKNKIVKQGLQFYEINYEGGSPRFVYSSTPNQDISAALTNSQFRQEAKQEFEDHKSKTAFLASIKDGRLQITKIVTQKSDPFSGQGFRYNDVPVPVGGGMFQLLRQVAPNSNPFSNSDPEVSTVSFNGSDILTVEPFPDQPGVFVVGKADGTIALYSFDMNQRNGVELSLDNSSERSNPSRSLVNQRELRAQLQYRSRDDLNNSLFSIFENSLFRTRQTSQNDLSVVEPVDVPDTAIVSLVVLTNRTVVYRRADGTEGRIRL